MGKLSENWRKQVGMVPSSADYAAFNTVIFIGLLLIQFGLGMDINLYVGITRHHPGAGATSFFAGSFDSVSWAIAHGPLALAIHAALGLAIIIGALHNFLWNLRWGTRGTVWATGAGLLLVLTAGLNGSAFLTYNRDLNSLLMALSFGAALLCYAITVYLLMRSPEAGKAPRSARSRPQHKQLAARS